MKKFMFLYGMEGDHSEEGKKKWMEWFSGISENTVDGGNPLINGHYVINDSVEKTEMEKEFVTGYSLVNAEDMESALEMAKGCPGGVRVYEALSM